MSAESVSPRRKARRSKPLTNRLRRLKAMSSITVGLQNEIFQVDKPLLVGVDVVSSTYCYLLQGVECRDEDLWGFYLLDVMEPEGRHCGAEALYPATVG